jgi:hypothetical protein
MSSLSAPRAFFANKSKMVNKIGRKAKSGKTFYAFAMVAVGGSDGYLKPNDGTAGDKIRGVAELKNHPSVVTTGSDGATSIDVESGIFPFLIGTSGDVVAQGDIGNIVYGIDDQTIGKTDGGTQRPRAGELVDIETIGGVTYAWVAIGVEWQATSAVTSGTVDAVSAAGAVSPNTDITELSITGTMAFTLAAGTRLGQRKVVVTVAAASTPVGTLTSASSHGWTTISALGALGRAIEFEWTANGWDICGGLGVTVA